MWIGSKCKKNGFVKNGHLRCWCDGQSEPNSTFQETRGSFLESPDNWRARKAGLVYMHDRGFNSFASNMIKLSVNEIKWSSLLARTHALILFISIWIYLILPGLSRNGPLVDLANSYSESSGSMVSRLFLIRVATKHRSRSVVSLFWNEVKIKWVWVKIGLEGNAFVPQKWLVMAGDIVAISRIMIEKTWWVMIFASLLPLLASVCLQTYEA